MASLGHFFHRGEDLRTKIGLAAGSYELIGGVGEVVRWFEGGEGGKEGVFEGIARHEEGLQGVLLGYLNGRGDVRVLGEREPGRGARVPVVSFVVEGRGSRGVVEKIEERSAYACRWGHFYSKRLVDDVLGIEGRQGEEGEGVGKWEGEGVVRVSMVFYNTGMFLISTRFENSLLVG